jgi:hypothetical protein
MLCVHTNLALNEYVLSVNLRALLRLAYSLFP